MAGKFITRLNRFINKIGADKVMHALVGAMVTLMVFLIVLPADEGNPFSWWSYGVGAVSSLIIVACVAWAKECLDDVADKKDVTWTMIGQIAMLVFITAVYVIKLV